MDAGLRAWLDALGGPPARDVGVEALRAPRTRARGPELAVVEERTIPGDPPLAARLYRPSPQERPLVLFLHGGMWLFCDLETHDRTCRRLALAADVGLLAIDYARGRSSRRAC